jgi:hypothetical protein
MLVTICAGINCAIEVAKRTKAAMAVVRRLNSILLDVLVGSEVLIYCRSDG